MTTLFVSPHLDDVALSVPATVRSLVDAGERVFVLTVFSEGDARHVARREEDARALALLGAEPVHLGLRDAPLRRGIAESFRSLVLSPVDEDDADLEHVTRAIASEVQRLAPTVTLLPLGVGEHLDHRIVHACHVRLGGRVGFYEDRPYAFVRHAAGARLARLGAVVDGVAAAPPDADEYRASVAEAAYVKAFLPAEERAACLDLLVEARRTMASTTRLELRRERLRFGREAIDDAARAIESYASQLESLFGGVRVAAALAREEVPYEERIYWRET